METILPNPERRKVNVKIVVTNVEDCDPITKHSICFGSKHHRTDHIMAISQGTLCVIFCQWRHITLQCQDIEYPRCLLYSDPYILKNHKCEVTIWRGRDRRGNTHTITKYPNCRGLHYATSIICPVQKQVITLVHSMKDEWRKIEIEMQHKQEKIEEEKARCEAAGNAGREEREQEAVVMEILRKREASMRPVTRDKEDDNLRMRDVETAKRNNRTRGIATRHHQRGRQHHRH